MGGRIPVLRDLPLESNLLFVHYWHKIRANGVCPSGYLGEEARLGKQCWGTCVGRFTAQHVHLQLSTSGGDDEEEGSFQVST